jgi:ribosomal peptide maturation radical SAM protein 1
MDFRSKSPDRVFQEIMTLAARHRWLRLFAVDNILDMRYMRELLPKLRQERTDIRLFYETKANLRKDQLRLMREAGVRDVQPGIETFSNSILKLMRKGTTGLQNIRLLKWCAQLGVDVHWNIIYGLPGEPAEEYDRMAGVLRTLSHLKPPQLVRLCIDRFSPYHREPESHGLRIVGPLRWYQYVYDIAPDDLMDLAYQFEAEYTDGRDPESYVGKCREAVDQWRAMWPGSQGALTYSRGPGFLTITDRRPNFPACTRRLDELEADIYLACDGGPSIASIREALLNAGWDASITQERILAIAEELTRAGYMYEEEGKYLSLALRENANEIIGGLEATDYEREPARERVGLKEQIATCDSSQQLIKILSNYAPRRFEGRVGQSAAHSPAAAGATGVSEDVRVE